MRIGLIAEGAVSVPAVHCLAEAHALAALGFGYADPVVQEGAGAFCATRGIPFQGWSRGGLMDQVSTWVESHGLDLVLTLGFPARIPPDLLKKPRAGFLNLHLGRLPAYRGPQPVFWQIRQGEAAGAVVLHRMEATYDTGPALLEQAVALGPDTTHGAHLADLGRAIPALLLGLLAGLAARGEAFLDMAVPQGEGTWWPRPSFADVCLDWSRMGACQVRDLARACNPWNSGAWTFLDGRPCRVVAAPVQPGVPAWAGAPGTVFEGPGGLLLAGCADGGAVRLDILRLDEGFLSGVGLREAGLRPGSRFGEAS